MERVDDARGNGKSSAILAAALDYAARGRSVIPLRPRDKVPLVPWKLYQSRRATADEIRAWRMATPNANVGIVCGAVSGGLVVVDADDAEAIAAVRERVGPFDPPEVETARGRHFYFRTDRPPRNGAKLAGLDLDLRGESGYVVAPPSVHESGHVYARARAGDPVLYSCSVGGWWRGAPDAR